MHELPEILGSLACTLNHLLSREECRHQVAEVVLIGRCGAVRLLGCDGCSILVGGEDEAGPG